MASHLNTTLNLKSGYDAHRDSDAHPMHLGQLHHDLGGNDDGVPIGSGMHGFIS